MSRDGNESDDDFASMVGSVKKLAPRNYVPLRQQIATKEGLDRLQSEEKRELAQQGTQGTEPTSDDFGDECVLDPIIRYPVEPWDVLEFKRDGIQNNVFKKLKNGQYPIEDRIDLHGLRVHQAMEALKKFLLDSFGEGYRTVLVVHGKGARSDPPAVLKSLVNQWLQEIPFILAFHSAQLKEGGSGSTYVMIKKNRAQKNNNRERFDKGRT